MVFKYVVCGTVWLLSFILLSSRTDWEEGWQNKPYLAYKCIFGEWEFTTYRIV